MARSTGLTEIISCFILRKYKFSASFFLFSRILTYDLTRFEGAFLDVLFVCGLLVSKI